MANNHIKRAKIDTIDQSDELDMTNYTGCFISSDMISNLHKIIVFWSFKAEILDLEISKLYILISCFS